MPIIGDVPRPLSKIDRKLFATITDSLTGGGPHDIATGLTSVDICLANPVDALVDVRASPVGDKCRIYSGATPSQSVKYVVLAVGKP